MTPRIAIISDDMQAGTSSQQILQHEGYDTMLLTEAHGAIQQLAQDPPDAILFNLRLENAESYGIILRLLRLIPALHDVPVIVYAPNHPVLTSAAPKLVALGCRVLITPFAVDEFLRLVDEILPRTQHEAVIVPPPRPETPDPETALPSASFGESGPA